MPRERVVPIGPVVASVESVVVKVELEPIDALEFLQMTLAHLNVAWARVDLSRRAPQ